MISRKTGKGAVTLRQYLIASFSNGVVAAKLFYRITSCSKKILLEAGFSF
jgi:hypothetical protein